MAKFQPGQSGNAGGRPKLPEELRIVRKVTSEEVIALVSKFFRMPDGDLDGLLASPQTNGLTKSIIRNIKDYRQLGWLLDRTIGKVVEQVAVYQGVGNPEDYEAITPDAIKTLIKQAEQKTIDVTPKSPEEKPDGNAVPAAADSTGDRKI